MARIRWGIAGPGDIAHKFARAVCNVDCAVLSAVASRSEERARSFADEFSIPNVFSSYDDMASSDKVDAVYVSTIHTQHFECAKMMLEAKKHVLCEKPMCVNEKQARELIKCARKNGVFLMEAMWTRFIPALSEAGKLIDGGAIGKPMSLTADFCYSLERHEDPKLFDNSLAGGALLDVGVYGLTLAEMVFKESPSELSSFANVQFDTDVHTQIIMKYGGGEIASVSCATMLQKPSDAFIYGTKGIIYIPDFYKASEFFVRTADGSEKRYSYPYGDNGFEFEIEETCRCIKEGRNESCVMTHGKTLGILRLTDEIRKQIGVRYRCD